MRDGACPLMLLPWGGKKRAHVNGVEWCKEKAAVRLIKWLKSYQQQINMTQVEASSYF